MNKNMRYGYTENILGVNVAVTDMKHTLSFLTGNLLALKGEYICVSNVHTTVMAYEDKEYKKIQNQATMVLPDGKPLSVVERIRGRKGAKKVSGPDLMPELFRISEEKGYTHYFYGSKEDTLKRLERNIQKKYPKLQIAGMYSPPFRKLSSDEDDIIVKRISEASPDFIWVGLGAPKQEIWMAEHRGKLPGLMIGVGAGFDFHAGTVKRAPLWMQNSGLEWLYRLSQDPKRLWRRYVTTNVKFLWYLLKEIMFSPS